ncbi:MAG: alpha/beta hydrolase family protein [Candidatus Thiodiazotropha sp. (ex Semelilucina semeliformis)]|nr:alpha/beta hydrolase family protein [Candidatus Thiodiazotropha sp. (ex Semelilucina semeliformis)]
MAMKYRFSRAATDCIGLFLLLLFFSGNVLAANLTLERKISQQLDSPALIGESVWLETGNIRFFAILNESLASELIGGVILLHDTGQHADWHEIIAPLRHHLSEKGWDTLSIQLPVTSKLDLASNSLLGDASLRIQAAVDYFSARENTNLVLIGHGLGAHMALTYLAEAPSVSVRALVALSLSAESGKTESTVISSISSLKVPMFDLYGSLDRPNVTDSAKARRAAGKKHLKEKYRQSQIMGANHDYTGLQESLQRRIEAWLKRVALGMEKPR